MAITKMNGKPLNVSTWTDFGQPGRFDRAGRHTSVKAAQGAWKRLYSHWCVSAPAQWWIIDENGRHHFSSEKLASWWDDHSSVLPPFIRAMREDFVAMSFAPGKRDKEVIRDIVACIQKHHEDLTAAIEVLEASL